MKKTSNMERIFSVLKCSNYKRSPVDFIKKPLMQSFTFQLTWLWCEQHWCYTQKCFHTQKKFKCCRNVKIFSFSHELADSSFSLCILKWKTKSRYQLFVKHHPEKTKIKELAFHSLKRDEYKKKWYTVEKFPHCIVKY